MQEITDFDVTTTQPDPVEPAVVAEPAATEPAAVDLDATPAEEAAEEAAAEQQERDEQGQFRPKKRSLQAKIDRATAEREEARRDAATARQERDRLATELATLKAPKPAITEPPSAIAAFPTLEEYIAKHPSAQYEDYVVARAKDEIKREAKAEAEQAQQATAQDTQRTQLRALEAQIVLAKAKYPDWDVKTAAADAAFAAAGVQMPAVMVHAICASEKGAEIMRDLAEHPADAIQLAKDAAGVPVAAAPVMRRLLEHRLTGSAAHSGPAAPVRTLVAPPIKPVGSGPVASDAPPGDDASFEEHERYYNAVDRKKRRG